VVRKVGIALAVLLLLAAAGLWAAGSGLLGRHEAPGAVTSHPARGEVVAARGATRRAAAEALGIVGQPKQILFGDLHVHTTFSSDAYLLSLPLAQGEGAHRYCSALDFWSINDHAEALTPRHWRETVESIRQCNAVAGESAGPGSLRGGILRAAAAAARVRCGEGSSRSLSAPGATSTS
jgi:hypothetical protein